MQKPHILIVEDEDVTRFNLRNLFEAVNEKRGILQLLDRCEQASGVRIFIGNESSYTRNSGNLHLGYSSSNEHVISGFI